MSAVKQSDLTATREEREANAQSIHDIPHAEFPDAEARAELIWRALRGEDVYAYRPVGLEGHVVWVRQAHPSIEARFAPMEWARLWREGLQPRDGEGDGDGQREGETEKGGAA